MLLSLITIKDKCLSLVVETAAKAARSRINLDGMEKLLISEESRKEFSNLRHAIDEVNHDLKTKFSQEMIEKLSKGELPQSEYPCMNEPSTAAPETSNSSFAWSTQAPSKGTSSAFAHSLKSRCIVNWASPRNSDDGCSSNRFQEDLPVNFRLHDWWGYSI